MTTVCLFFSFLLFSALPVLLLTLNGHAVGQVQPGKRRMDGSEGPSVVNKASPWQMMSPLLFSIQVAINLEWPH